MKNYWRLLHQAGVARVLFSQLLARFPYGMISIAFVIHIQHSYHSYALAGLVLGAETVGVGVAGPLLGRLLGRVGIRKILLICALTSSAAIATIALVHLPPVVVLALALVAGFMSPPVQSAARTTYPTLIAEEKHTMLFGLDATLQEVIWIFGPIIATFLAASVAPELTLLVIALILIAGVLWFLSNPEVLATKFEKPAGRLGKVLTRPIVLASVSMGFLLVGSFAGIEVGVVGIFTNNRALAGLVISVFSVGSIIGGLAFSQLRQTKSSFAVFSGVLTVGFALTFFAPSNPLWLAFCLMIAGLGVAPFLGMLSAVISFSLQNHETAEAFGWVNTGQMIGYSAAAAITGLVIDGVSPQAALFVSVGFGLATLAVAWATIAITPQLPFQGLPVAGKKTSSEPTDKKESSTK